MRILGRGKIGAALQLAYGCDSVFAICSSTLPSATSWYWNVANH